MREKPVLHTFVPSAGQKCDLRQSTEEIVCHVEVGCRGLTATSPIRLLKDLWIKRQALHTRDILYLAPCSKRGQCLV